MNDEQRAAAFALLGTGLSERGTMLAQGVIELEGTLRELEGGPKEGHRLLAGEEDLGFALVNMLDTLQRSRAIIAAQPYGDVVTGSDPAVQSMAFAGLPALEMTVDQKTQLRTLLELYASRMADSSAVKQMRRIDEAGFDRLHFAWAGATQPGEGHYYRIHGPTVLVEFDNSFGNHIHSVWRDLEHDFGGDLLRKHYARHAHGK